MQRLLHAPERKTTRPGRAKHLPSLIAHCGVCGGTLNVNYRDTSSLHICHINGCVRITQADHDTYAEHAMLTYLASPDVIDALRAAEHDEITQLEAREKELSIPSALRGLIKPGPGVAQRWKPTPISTRREVARLLLTPDLLGQLRLQPSPRRGRIRTPARERVQWWRG